MPARIAIIAAMAGELKPLVSGWTRGSRNGVELWRVRRGDAEWVAACAGAGSGAALRAWSEVEKDGAVDAVFSVGWAGALTEKFAKGQAYTVSGVIDAETGERFRTAADVAPECWLVTSPRVADRAEKCRLAATLGASLVDMEAAGVACAAAQRGVPFYCVKGVSDGVDDRLPDFNRFIANDGKFQTGRFMAFAALRPRHWPALVRLGVHSRKAAEAMRERVLEWHGSPDPC